MNGGDKNIMKYKIEDVKEKTRIDEQGFPYKTFVIRYSIETGFKGTVELPKGLFSEKKALEEIEKEIKELMALEGDKDVVF